MYKIKTLIKSEGSSMKYIGLVMNKFSIKETDYGILISTPANKEFADRLKNEIPIEEREWRNEIKSWWVSDGYAFEAEAIARDIFEK